MAARRPTRSNRRALTNVGGAVFGTGDRALVRILEDALKVAGAKPPRGATSPGRTQDDATRAHVHGFHTYPARMHPVTAARLINALSEPGGHVLDPFCGGGTVAVEARLAGRRATASDLNPLAVRLTARKVTPLDKARASALVAASKRVVAVADERRRAKAGASRRYPKADVEVFEPHILLELDGLRVGIDTEPSEELRDDLQLVLSSIIVKLSRQGGDTSRDQTPRRLAGGFGIRMFDKRTSELVERSGKIARKLLDAPPARVFLADARDLSDHVEDETVDLIVTSPPYPGIYDYVEHHALRMRWLELSAQGLADGEIGARRHSLPKKRPPNAGPTPARARWRDEVSSLLKACSRVLKRGGRAVLWIGDGVLDGKAERTDRTVRELAPAAGLAVEASASQQRPHFHGPTARIFTRQPRLEHAILLCRL